jgi:hypothetical protein
VTTVAKKDEPKNGKNGEAQEKPAPPVPSRLRKMRLAELRAEAQRRGLEIQYTPKTYRRDYIAAIQEHRPGEGTMAEKKSGVTYQVHRGFARGGKWFSPQNTDEVKKLSDADRDDLIQRGFISEQDATTKEKG